MDETSLSTNFRSSQDFVRTLKVASDPPVVGGPSKIEIAQEAWNDQQFHVPNKAEIITEWLLGRLLKEKGKEISSNPLFDTRYWRLTLGLISQQGFNDTRPVKTWLTPLLQRIPLGPMVASFLGSFDDAQMHNKSELVDLIVACLSVLWPIAVQRMSVELLQECFGGLLSQSPGTISKGMLEIGRIISSSYRNSLMNSSNKKKLHQSFLQSYLRSWLRCVAPQDPIFDSELTTLVYEAGMETLLNLDILRQYHDIHLKPENTLVEQLHKISLDNRDLVLRIIPVIFKYYILALTKHRGALYGQSSQGRSGTSLNELRQAGISVFVSFMALVDEAKPEQLSWETRLALMQVIAQENLFDQQQRDIQDSFNQIVERVLDALSDSRNESLECATLAVQCLSTIARIDYDFLSPFVPRILPRFLEVALPNEAHFLLLESLLQYHVKTRTMLALVETLFSSLSALSTPLGSPREAYQLYFSSPVMHDLHLHLLSQALPKFTTETQCLPMMQYTFNAIKTAREQCYGDSSQDAGDGGSKKKPKSMNVDDFINREGAAVTYSLVARLASVVLSSLPLRSLSDDTREEVRTSLTDFRSSVVEHSISKALKALMKRAGSECWGLEVSLIGNLRLLYALEISRDLSLPPRSNSKIQAKMLGMVAQDEQLPELTLELFRALFYGISSESESKHEEIINKLLDCLEKRFSPSHVHWSGQSYHLTNGEPGKSESALAILHMIVERWLPSVDRLASTEQLQRLLKIIVAINFSMKPHPGQTMLPEHLLLQILHSAQFWELRNIRDVFLNLLQETTASLDGIHSKPKKSSKILEKASIYRLLLIFPMDYFSWQSLSDLMRRALQTDFALSQLSSSVDDATVETWIVLRMFLKRAYAHTGTLGQESNQDQSAVVLHLLSEQQTQNERFRDDFIRTTLDLVDIHLTKLLKGSLKNPSSSLLNVFAAYGPDIFIKAPGVTSASFTRLVDLLSHEFSPNSVHESVRGDLRRLCDVLSSRLLHCIRTVTAKTFQQGDVPDLVNLVSGWHSLLCLDKWLGSSETSVVPCVGGSLAATVIPSIKPGSSERTPELNELCLRVFAVLLQEIDRKPESEHEQHLNVIVAVYITFAEIVRVESRNKLNAYLAKTCRKMGLADYTRLLTMVSDFLSDPHTVAATQLRPLVQLASLLVREHPSHSLVHIQKFMTKSIGTFTRHSIFVEGPQGLRLQVLEMVAQHCSDPQAALRSLDVAGVWLLISKFLAPCKEHDEATQPEIFQHIIMIISPLIRHRRDLVSLSLPHLGLILRQLLLSFRGCRPHLGPKQLSLVMNTQPQWISALRPLGEDEAKALGRLLESLTTKTTVRVPTSSVLETQKAESLAKPFSKHAAYVLKAYIESMNDPLCILSLEVRKELKPGMFALCGMMSEHSRDALMVSALDTGGKAMLKALWKEYEKQRYVGRG